MSEELRELHGKARRTAETLTARADEAFELARRMEKLTDGTPEWYPGVRIEAATVRQVRTLMPRAGGV